MAEKAAGFDGGGTGVVTEIGRWNEKNEATWISGPVLVRCTSGSVPVYFTLWFETLRRRHAGHVQESFVSGLICTMGDILGFASARTRTRPLLRPSFHR